MAIETYYVPEEHYKLIVPEDGEWKKRFEAAFKKTRGGNTPAREDWTHIITMITREGRSFEDVEGILEGQPQRREAHTPPWPESIQRHELIDDVAHGPGPAAVELIKAFKEVTGGNEPAMSDWRHWNFRALDEGWTLEKMLRDIRGQGHDHIPLLVNPRRTPDVPPSGSIFERPTSVGIDNGRIQINGMYPGLHAISAFQIAEYKLRGRPQDATSRMDRAATVGLRNVLRSFTEYSGGLGQLVPSDWPTQAYDDAMLWTMDEAGKRGMLVEWNILADRGRRSDGTGGIGESLDSQEAHVRRIARILKGHPCLACIVNEGYYNGVEQGDHAHLVRAFLEETGGTVPFGVTDAYDEVDSSLVNTPRDGDPMFGEQEAFVRVGANLLFLHADRKHDPHDWRRQANHIKGFSDLHGKRPSTRNALLYNQEPYGFANQFIVGKRDSNGEVALAMAAVSAASQQGFCYHHTENYPGTPGLDLLPFVREIPQTPDARFFNATTGGAPVQAVNWNHIPGGKVRCWARGSDFGCVVHGGTSDDKHGITIQPDTLQWVVGSKTTVIKHTQHVYIAHRS